MPLEVEQLLQASAEGDLEHVELLISKGVDVNSSNVKGWTALTVAAYNQNLEVVKYLIEQGADVNHANVNGTTVLMYAKSKIIGTLNYEIINYLLDKGADPSRKDFKKGWTVLEYISDLGDKDLVNHIGNYTNK